MLNLIEGFYIILLYSSFKFERKFQFCVSPLVKRFQAASDYAFLLFLCLNTGANLTILSQSSIRPSIYSSSIVRITLESVPGTNQY